MGVKGWTKACLNRGLKRYGQEIVLTEDLYEWQRVRADKPCWNDSPLPAEAAQYLRPDNPKLIELSKRYSAFDSEVTTPLVWTDSHVRPEDLLHFRGDNAWVWQVRGRNANLLGYAVTFYYLKSIDRFGLLEKLHEDNSFGNFTFEIGNRLVSRDLLDSINDIYFLDRHLKIGTAGCTRVLDIGAGYGRLAYRMTSALPGIQEVLCTDAVAFSTFVSDYYLRFRGAAKALVIPLDEIDKTLEDHPIELAANILSFSECRVSAIEWWTRLLRKHRVKYLMISPNCCCGSNGELLLTNDGHDFLPVLERYGYKTVLKEPKYLDPVIQEYGLYPSWYHLLELRT